jgi:hypothetical protein
MVMSSGSTEDGAHPHLRCFAYPSNRNVQPVHHESSDTIHTNIPIIDKTYDHPASRHGLCQNFLDSGAEILNLLKDFCFTLDILIEFLWFAVALNLFLLFLCFLFPS